MTRARERLILSGAARFASWPRDAGAPISWLGPALVEDIAGARREPAAASHTVEGAGGVAGAPDAAAAPTASSRSSARAPARAGPPARPREPAPRASSSRSTRGAGAGAAPRRDPPTLSYTSLADYERCGYRYYLQRVLGLPESRRPASARGGRGRAGRRVHALLERSTSRAGIDFARRGRAAPGGDEVALAELAGAFARSPLCARLAAARRVAPRAPFAFVLGGRRNALRGFLDVAGVEPDGTMLIVDYKSDRVGDDEDLAEHVERDYAIQRQVYALAALSAGAPAVEVAHCFLRRPETVVSARYQASERAACRRCSRHASSRCSRGASRSRPDPGCSAAPAARAGRDCAPTTRR